MRERTNYQIRSDLNVEFAKGANYQIRSDLNVEFGDMKLWDDPSVVEEAAKSAIELYSHATTGVKLDKDTGMALFDKVATLLARCFVLCAEASIKKQIKSIEKQIKSKEVIDDPNM